MKEDFFCTQEDIMHDWHWRRTEVLPPKDKPEKRKRAIDIYADNFFKYIVSKGFSAQDILHLFNRILDKINDQLRVEKEKIDVSQKEDQKP